MKKQKYERVRKKFREYRLLKKELECRTAYIDEFKKVLINPLPKTEKSLLKVYSSIIKEMEKKAMLLASKLRLIEKVIDKLEGPQRSVMYYRYIEGIEWINMPEYMMYEQRTCQIFECNA